jgi:hypothetical protein
MLVALNTSIIGVLAVADQAKREAASTVAALHKLGLQVHSLLMYFSIISCLCNYKVPLRVKDVHGASMLHHCRVKCCDSRLLCTAHLLK